MVDGPAPSYLRGMRRIAVLVGAVAVVPACGGHTASPSSVSDAGRPSWVYDTGAPGDAAEVPWPSSTNEPDGGPPIGVEREDAEATDAAYAPSPDGGVCPAGMTLCPCHTELFCAEVCPLGCGLPPTPVPCEDASETCACYANVYCGAQCLTACDPRPADSGWCSAQYGAVRADEADATAGAPCGGECVLMLQPDAAADGKIPVQYGCSQ